MSDQRDSNPCAVFPTIRLQKRQERRVLSGHDWIYRNEIDTKRVPLTSFEPGQVVNVQTADGLWVGNGYLNPHSLIAMRIASRDWNLPFNEDLIEKRIQAAANFRDRLFEKPFYRLIHGESDCLPGLVIDRFSDVFVVQINTAGMENMKDTVVRVLQNQFAAKTIVFRCDTPLRKMEQLEPYTETIGDSPQQVIVEEGDCKFAFDLAGGQKTGWFYDQRENRSNFLSLVKGKTVVDVCSYVGAWGVAAAAAGATEVICVDSSESALEQLADNAKLNDVENQVVAAHGDAFDILKSLKRDEHQADVVVLDPPAFVKRKKDLKNGTEAYTRLMRRGLQILKPGGILVTCSCSHHMPRDLLVQRLGQAGRDVNRSLQIFREGKQAADHPIHPAMPETEYLKAFFVRTLN